LTESNALKLGISDGWRGFKIDFLRDVVKARVVDTRSLYFPVLVNSVEVGYVRAFVKKPSKPYPSYLNRPGAWSADKGLLMFDQAIALIKRHSIEKGFINKTIILTEGPRDVFRLIRDGLPGCSILGTQSWSDAKLRVILMQGVDNIILCLDGDEAGRTASRTLRESVAGSAKVVDFKLWEWEGSYDPFNMPDKLFNKLRKVYEELSNP
jgi:5S rRNA maturation endonuclease (ribonuclease M5)